MRTSRLIAALALPLALGLTACGGDDADSAVEPTAGETTSQAPSEEPTTSEPSPSEPAPSPTEPSPTADPSADWPACGQVWQDETKLPAGYAGCREGEQAVAADKRGCAFGRPLITYADRFWAVPTGTVHESDGALEQDRSYQSDLASCTG